jgi:hypothetical protein
MNANANAKKAAIISGLVAVAGGIAILGFSTYLSITGPTREADSRNQASQERLEKLRESINK